MHFVYKVSGEVQHFNYNITEICENLQTLYEVIYPVVNMELDLDFGRNSHNFYLYGNGTVVFSPYMTINQCSSNKRHGKTFINVLVNDILTIRFETRSWIVIEDCEISIFVSTSTSHCGRIVIRILSIDVAKFSRASVKCGQQDLIRPDKVKYILSSALARSSLVERRFLINCKSTSKSALTEFLRDIFKYYMSKLALNDNMDI
ncbi:uncharacterized protein [Halyomorpha halys]|uniref:uncharacterized protein n=1 Tax=Halyomorpha halys TaxID=286706 RepID=UPI0006D4DEB2|nr:uncharacterized protein LOC106686273 [Halyomorpha halys]